MRSCLVSSLFVGMLAIALLALAVVIHENNPATMAQRQAEIVYRQRMDELTAQERAIRIQQNARFTDAIMPVLEGMTMALIIVLPIVAAVAGYAWLRRRHRDHHELIYPDERGLYPVSRDGLLRGAYDGHVGAAIAGHHQTNITAAANPAPRLPDGLRTYSPRYAAPKTTELATPPPLAAPPEPLKMLPPPVTLSQALPGAPTLDKILVGTTADGPLTVSAPNLCHVALVGATGQGKSSIMRLLLSQLLAAGARVVLADPHYARKDARDATAGDWEPIERRLLFAPAVSAPDIDYLLRWTIGQLEQRLVLRSAGGWSGDPLFVAVDELPVITAQNRDAMPMLTRILREGRKVDLFAISSAQDMLTKTLGGNSAARDAFRTAYYMGGDLHSASALLDMPRRDIAAQEASLARGVALTRSAATSAAELVRVPFADDASVRYLLPPGSAGRAPEWAQPPQSRAGVASINGDRVRRGDVDVGQSPTSPEPVDEVDADNVLHFRPRPPGGRTGGRADASVQTSVEPSQTPQEPPARPVEPPARPTLIAKAEASGIPLTEDERSILVRLDRGLSPAYIAKADTNSPTTDGRPYRRRRAQVDELQRLVEGWPDGEQWTAST